MHVTPAFSFFSGEEAFTRRSSSSISSSRPRIAAPADRSTASAVQPGCLPRPEASELARSPGRGSRSHRVRAIIASTQGKGDTGTSKYGCGLLFIFFARTPQTMLKLKQKIKKQNKIVRHSRESTRNPGPRINQRINVKTITCLDP